MTPRRSKYSLIIEMAVERAVEAGERIIVAYPGHLHIFTAEETRIVRASLAGRNASVILDDGL